MNRKNLLTIILLSANIRLFADDEGGILIVNLFVAVSKEIDSHPF
jgi:hypothetical protein